MTGYVNPIGPGLQPARVDMGVDYTGSGPLYALGDGQIVNVNNSGWPGGRFIGLKLDNGQYVYYAENVIPHVTVGQRVNAGQLVATAIGTYPFTEVGWAAPPGTGQTSAAAAGQSKLGESQGDPGKYPTGFGVSMSQLIASLGGPAGIVSGPVQGTVPATPSSGGGAGTALVSAAGSAPVGCLFTLLGFGMVLRCAVFCKTQWGRYIPGSKRANRESAR